MIHDIILSCLNIHSEKIPTEEFLMSDAICKYFHPCEKNILKDIVKIINLLRNVAKFAQIYRNRSPASSTIETSIFDTDEPLQNGLYLRAFANGIANVLDCYLRDITELEHNYLLHANQSLMSIYQKMQEYEPLALYLAQLVRGVCTQRLHGCAIVQYLQQHSLHGDASIIKAFKLIQTAVNAIFLKQLTHWILYANILDSYGEFFIQCSESVNSTLESEKGTINSGRLTTTSNSDAASNYADIWRYEICYELLPGYLSFLWAEKVLFIGQTVLIFKVDTDKFKKKFHIWNKTDSDCLDRGHSLWNEKEHIYFAKIQALQNDDELIASHYESVIDEIKYYVTTRLSEIAINQASLVKQLILLKDFYLLGRGELYLEYVRQICIINKDNDTSNKLREFVKAFESAAHSVGVSDELEQFSVCMPKSLVDTDESLEFGYLQLIQLQYKINWPLHLLFSPKVLERYNILFRFLILIKKIQYDLHMIWSKSFRKSKEQAKLNVNIMHLRNELTFFVDNLQYYIQVDVLDSQFSILLNTVLNEADFEQIQRAHSVFQANILSLCFIQTDEDANKTNLLRSTSLNSTNPVYLIINEVFHICNDFCNIVDNEESNGNVERKTDELSERFSRLVKQLIDLLVGLKSAPSTGPLSQFLLRLDYNHWFSNKKIDS